MNMKAIRNSICFVVGMVLGFAFPAVKYPEVWLGVCILASVWAVAQLIQLKREG